MSDIAPDAPETVDVADLTFDLKNPRLVEFDMTGHSGERDIVRTLWETMDVRELVMSIAASGFFRHEPVVVCREDDRNVVIEGNRRLAAVKLIRDAALAQEVGATIPDLPAEAREALSQIPVVFDTREHAWRYLGFKHVNGPAKWNSYAKSRYIADVRRQFGVELADIASQIGDTHQTVQRISRGLMVIEQAERLRVFDRKDRWRNHFAFSHLYTGLGYSHISDFIGLRPETEERMDPVPDTKLDELSELCLWIYGSKRRETPPRSSNARIRTFDSLTSCSATGRALQPCVEAAGLTLRTRPAVRRRRFSKSRCRPRRDTCRARTASFRPATTDLALAQNGQRRGQSCRRPLRTNGTQARSRQETARHGQRLMFKWPETPSPRAEANELADFAELEAWRQGSFSRTAFSKALVRLDDHDYTQGVPEEDADRTVVEDAYLETERRRDACRDGYPFEVADGGQVLRAEALSPDHWYSVSRDAGLLFDRCRIVDFADDIRTKVVDDIVAWTEAAETARLES